MMNKDKERDVIRYNQDMCHMKLCIIQDAISTGL